MPSLTISPAQRTTLRAEAHALKPVVLIGADGLTDAVLAEIERALFSHQLIKVRVFSEERDVRTAMMTEICERLDAAPVQRIGKLLVVWRPEAAAAPAPATRPHAPERTPGKGRAPRIVTVVKPSALRRPKPQKVVVRGNERVTAGGNVKRAKKRQSSVKKQLQNDK